MLNFVAALMNCVISLFSSESSTRFDFCIVNLSLDFVAQRELKFYIQKRINHSRLSRTCTSRSGGHTIISDEFEALVI